MVAGRFEEVRRGRKEWNEGYIDAVWFIKVVPRFGFIDSDISHAGKPHSDVCCNPVSDMISIRYLDNSERNTIHIGSYGWVGDALRSKLL